MLITLCLLPHAYYLMLIDFHIHGITCIIHALDIHYNITLYLCNIITYIIVMCVCVCVCVLCLQLLTLTSGPYPNVSTDGVERQPCPAYTADRRPELEAANAYFAAIGGKSDSQNTWQTWPLLFLSMSFVAGGVAVVMALMVRMQQTTNAIMTHLLLIILF
jgi:hypothetical protein